MTDSAEVVGTASGVPKKWVKRCPAVA